MCWPPGAPVCACCPARWAASLALCAPEWPDVASTSPGARARPKTSAAGWRGRSRMGRDSPYSSRSRALPWDLRRRGLKDSLRHDQRVKEAIRKNLRELIAEEAIITSDGTKRIRIPLRYLDQYRFKYGQPPQGVGQGP